MECQTVIETLINEKLHPFNMFGRKIRAQFDFHFSGFEFHDGDLARATRRNGPLLIARGSLIDGARRPAPRKACCEQTKEKSSKHAHHSSTLQSSIVRSTGCVYVPVFALRRAATPADTKGVTSPPNLAI